MRRPAIGRDRIESLDRNDCSMMAPPRRERRTVPVATTASRCFRAPWLRSGRTVRPVIGRELIEEPVARSSADDANVRVAAAVSSSATEHDAILSARLENRARVSGLSGRLQAWFAGMRRWRTACRRIEEAGGPIEDRTEGQAIISRRDEEVVVDTGCPAQPAAHARLKEPEPRDVLEQRVVPLTPPSFVKLSSRARAR